MLRLVGLWLVRPTFGRAVDVGKSHTAVFPPVAFR